MNRTLIAAVVVVAGVGVGTALGTAPTDGAALGAADDGPAFELVARYPTEDGHRNETVLTPDGVASVGNVTESRRGSVYVPITLTGAAARNFSRALAGAGFTTDGISACAPDWRTTDRDTWCLLTVLDGEVVYSAGVAPGLADQIRSGEFTEDPRLRMLTENRSEARELRAALTGEPVTTTTRTERGDGSGSSLPAPGFSAVVAAGGLVAGLLVYGRRRRE